jgi:hypothetical protein
LDELEKVTDGLVDELTKVSGKGEQSVIRSSIFSATKSASLNYLLALTISPWLLQAPPVMAQETETDKSKTTVAPIPEDIQHLCKVTCIEPHANCDESKKVIETLQAMAHALNKGDIATYESYLDDGCTTFDEGSKKLLVGKKAVMENMTVRDGKGKDSQLLNSITIDQPYCQVSGNTAVVTFKAIRELGGEHPYTEVCHATDVFVRVGDGWKRLHFRGHWKKLTASQTDHLKPKPQAHKS